MPNIKSQRSKEDKRKIIAIDIDGTLTADGYIKNVWKINLDELDDYYEKVEPNKEMINQVNRLYEKGFIIYIFSSRWDIFQHTTKHWLLKHGVKFHFLTMNKPYYDFLIDDKAINPKEVEEWQKNL